MTNLQQEITYISMEDFETVLERVPKIWRVLESGAAYLTIRYRGNERWFASYGARMRTRIPSGEGKSPKEALQDLSKKLDTKSKIEN
mgnify:CR=1 FL=1